MALASSFLGVSLGLFDYLADFFTLSGDAAGRTKTVLVTFVPSTLAALLFPNGFLYAIGFAGLAATPLGSDRAGADDACQPPPLPIGQLSRTGRQRHDPVHHYLVVRTDQCCAHILSLLDLLPVFK